MTIIVYITTSGASSSIFSKQGKIDNILKAKKLEYTTIDIADPEHEGDKKKMRELIGDPTAAPPQIFNDDQYCGNYEGLEEANEVGEIEAFLKLK